MAYTPNEWACGDTLTAEKLNNIERGISEMNGEYVPTEWQCGDTITAEKLNKIEQGVANGGGSSDFSTAKITIASELTRWIIILNLPLMDEELDALIGALEIPNVEYSAPLSVVLYKGQCIGQVYSKDGTKSISVSGNATLDGEEITITGDCTITISGGKQAIAP